MSVRQHKTEHRRTDQKWKKGAGASPLLKLTPQNRQPSRGSGPATPGSQSFKVTKRRASVVPASTGQKFEIKLIENTVVSFSEPFVQSRAVPENLQNLTEFRVASMLFGNSSSLRVLDQRMNFSRRNSQYRYFRLSLRSRISRNSFYELCEQSSGDDELVDHVTLYLS